MLTFKLNILVIYEHYMFDIMYLFLLVRPQIITLQFSSVQLLSRVRLFVIPWIAACQDSLSMNNSWSLLKLTSIESVMLSSHLILCRPLLLLPPIFPASESFPMSQPLAWGDLSTGVSALGSFLPKKSQGWSPSEWTGWIIACLKVLEDSVIWSFVSVVTCVKNGWLTCKTQSIY